MMFNFILNFLILPVYLMIPFQDTAKHTVFKCTNGKIIFKSEAPLETISAESNDLRGVVDITNNTFAFSVAILSFKGFNGPLQKEHFNENYMESESYPTATFSGKIIEEVDFSIPGTFEVRAKGVLNIHGVKQERIIKSTIIISNKQIQIKSFFIIIMEDHNIRIPKIVYQKIAPEIDVTIDATLIPTSF